MIFRTIAIAGCMAGLPALAFAQNQRAPAAAAATTTTQATIPSDVQGLSADDFSGRQAAVRQLQSLIAARLKDRATLQQVSDTRAADLARQERALAMVGDVEAQAQIATLLQMERGLAGWTLQTMAEPLDRRKQLLDWGLDPQNAPLAARAYSQKRAVRLEALRELEKVPGDGADWTLSRLINDGDAAVRAAAMAVAWSRTPSNDVVSALWFRAISGPGTLADQESAAAAGAGPVAPEADDTIKVAFPEGPPVEFPLDDDAGAYTDAILAGDVLVHLHSPLVADRVKALVAQRAALGKNLTAATDPDWTLVTHRLVESFGIKEAVPMLAAEALSTDTEELSGNVNGRPYVWSPRTLAIGALTALLKIDPSNFQLIHVNETSELRGNIWGISMNPRTPAAGPRDAPAVRAFYAWWKQHHAEYGVPDAPSDAGIPPVVEPARRGLVGRNAPPASRPAPSGR